MFPLGWRRGTMSDNSEQFAKPNPTEINPGSSQTETARRVIPHTISSPSGTHASVPQSKRHAHGSQLTVSRAISLSITLIAGFAFMLLSIDGGSARGQAPDTVQAK